ncbi:polymer-forming cytoskeletal family protein, partial [Campylobacter coli]|nr:polymer-forming cytoskeletal family protein [Campylobacter coli]ELD3961961.1 polymer-forming cytoskeletal family protein [Campylobacter coli]
VVSGNISIKDLAIENGGRFNGTSKIKQEEPVRLLENSSE